MEHFAVTCSVCGGKLRGKFNSPATFICQKCGATSSSIELPEGSVDNTVVFGCVKCKDEFIAPANRISSIRCSRLKCGGTVVVPLRTMTLSSVSIDPLPPAVYVSKFSPRVSPPNESKIRLAIPYFDGGKRVERAIRTWIHPEVVFILTDQGIIPPGYGICKQIFTAKNGLSEGLSKQTRPYIINILDNLLKVFPNDEYFGYFNSDIILPQGTLIKNLLPRKDKRIVFHHRMEMGGKDEDPIVKLKPKYQVYCGKDGFIGDREIIQDIVKSMNDMILGGAAWDDGIAVWCAQKYTPNKVDLRYGEILHAEHALQWRNEDRESCFNRKQLHLSGIPDSMRNRINWFKVMNDEDEEIQKRHNKILGIIQPGRIGDIIIVLPIAKWYYDRGYKIVWPVLNEFLPLFNYINYVYPIDLGTDYSGSYGNSKKVLAEKEIKEVLDLGIGFGRDEKDWIKTGLTFDEWKYHAAKVPFKERFNLSIIRNLEKEFILQKELGLEDRKNYVVTHSVGTKGKINFHQLNSVEIRPLADYTVFDWIGIIEKADKVYCVDSCVSHLVNQLGLAKGRRYFRPFDNYSNRPGPIPRIEWDKDIITGKEESSNISTTKSEHILPIHFFTVVLNGMPFIKHQLQIFQSLPFDWHWHIVEGVADFKHDSRWALLKGGQIRDNMHKDGLSIDGTTEYLNNLKYFNEDHISIYRKGSGKFWDGKIEMCNSYISNLPQQCLLWQVDVDEFWSSESIIKMLELFEKYPDKMAAYAYCHYFVGPKKYVSTMNTWATHPEDWFRVFRFNEGFRWKRHEPPTLVDSKGIDVGRKKPFSRDETLSNGITFQHFAYVTPDQVLFKEIYYGYKNALRCWKRLQETTGKVEAIKYIPWATSGAMIEDWDESTMGKLIYCEG